MENPPDFIVSFDTDFFPVLNFLRATLPHLLADDNVELVSTHQDYYILPPGDPLIQVIRWYQERASSGLCEQGSKLATGTGWVIRRELAVQVEGFPTINEAEDLTLSIILYTHGKRVVILDKMLQLGRVPASIEGWVRQTRRRTTSFPQIVATSWTSLSRKTVPSACAFRIAKF
ncbi:hypothetical protein ASPSYDRAFT_94738 [Aspergillus sydowii CBS 593.65]|uniref:Uncharacterized protein n=1 Tax=Aspergillus sydowii CBS 593.65 TaxID=1036612 RepID=A0A1L9T295_9EURO|nr:uncharacterized protein ASPSYDRAFT_94738 [Aspergillus sydowii CBS 593.65]OJJ53538.1 hypothetical protein ASPSYDRAFT_94738 [Aspergillus sydowii CBS 593.65]